MKKHIVTLFVLAFMCISPAVFGLSMSVQVVQNFRDQNDPCSISYLIEQSVIDYFFDQGHIVSSAPVYVLSTEKDNKRALSHALAETADGGMDYLVTINVNYNVARELKNSAPLLLQYIKDVTWTVYRTVDGTELISGENAPGKITAVNNNEKGIVGFSSKLASQISAGLQKIK